MDTNIIRLLHLCFFFLLVFFHLLDENPLPPDIHIYKDAKEPAHEWGINRIAKVTQRSDPVQAHPKSDHDSCQPGFF